MKTLKTLFLSLAALALFAIPAGATAIPWGVINVQVPSVGAATCSTFSSDPVCILNLTGNLSALTLSGGTAGVSYTLVFMQDGTGSRTFAAPSNLIALSGQTLPAIPSAANAYTTWVVQKVGSNYVLQASYDNNGLFNVFATVQTSNGTGVTAGTMQAQPTIVVPGMVAAANCSCLAQTLPATWQTGIQLTCLPEVNAVQCEEQNPTAASITPAAVTLNVRIRP